jgi:hypothetical protein
MRRKPYLSLLLALVILGGMLALFPTLWMLLVIALLALVSLQVAVVRRNLYRLPPGHSQLAVPPTAEAMPARPVAEAEPAGAAAAPEAATAQPSGATAAADTAVQAGAQPAVQAGAQAAGEPARPNIDAELFSRFRKHLEQVEAETSGKAAPRQTPPPGGDEVHDRVNLSGAARRPPAQRAAPPARRPTSAAAERAAESEGADLFDDLRPAPLPAPPAPPPTPEPAPALPAATPPTESRKRSGRAAASASDAARESAPAQAAGGDEVSAALADRGRTDAPGLADEAAALLHLAEESSSRDDWEGMRAGLDNYVAHLADAPRLIHWNARRLQVRLAVHDGDSNRALQGFEDMLAGGYRPAMDDVPPLLDELLAGAERDAAASLRVSMLVRILAVFRQARDQRAMDRCYGWIEDAQEQVGDERRLLQYLKNHLEIRKALADVPGQLELIDQLGNRCYRLGLTDEAKVYYEMGLRLRAETDQPAPAGGAAQEG